MIRAPFGIGAPAGCTASIRSPRTTITWSVRTSPRSTSTERPARIAITCCAASGAASDADRDASANELPSSDSLRVRQRRRSNSSRASRMPPARHLSPFRRAGPSLTERRRRMERRSSHRTRIFGVQPHSAPASRRPSRRPGWSCRRDRCRAPARSPCRRWRAAGTSRSALTSTVTVVSRWSGRRGAGSTPPPLRCR